jgi:Xaa-Pro aminopeptidase
MSKSTAAIPQPYADRIARLRERMSHRRLDAYLIEDRMDQYWLTGFTGEDGAVLVTPRAVVLLTDSRFDETADLEAPYARKVLRKKRDAPTTAGQVKRFKPARLGFDPDHMTVRNYVGLRKLVRPTRLISTSRLMTEMRQVKDEQEVATIRRAVRFAEQAFRRIQRWIRPGVTERQVAARLIFEMQQLGADGPGFPPIVAVGANASLPHYAPGDAVVSSQRLDPHDLAR